MTWALFIDDERYPPEDNSNWKIARNFNCVKQLIDKYGPPTFISFDHDLGENVETGHDIAKRLVEMDMEGINIFNVEFDYYVHSQNPVGKLNIESYIDSYIKSKRL